MSRNQLSTTSPSSNTDRPASPLIECHLGVGSQERGETVVAHYGARFWAVYHDGKLLAVTVYKKGALAVQAALVAARNASE